MTTTPPEAPLEAEPDPAAESPQPPPTDAPTEAPYGASYGAGPGPRVGRDELRNLDRLRRTTGPDRTVAGVAGALGRYFDVDPLLFKVAFVVLSLFGGAGLFLYGALWVLIPEQGQDRAAIPLDSRSLAVALIGVVGIVGLFLIGGWSGDWWFPWPLAVIALIVAVIVAGRSRGGPPATVLGPDGTPLPTLPPASGYGAPGYPVAPPPPGMPTAAWAQQPEAHAAGQLPPADPTWNPVLPPPRPRDPRKRGPILFGFTLALLAFGLGVLGLVDVLSDAHVPATAYPALAVALIGLMLVVGAFVGRAGGLILAGIVAVAALGVTAVVSRVDDTSTIRYEPTSAAQVRDVYTFEAADFVLDLRRVADLDELDGRTIRIEGEWGQIRVIVPDGIDVDAAGTVHGPGETRVLGGVDNGFEDNRVTQSTDQPGTDSRITIEAFLDLGAIEISQYETGARR